MGRLRARTLARMHLHFFLFPTESYVTSSRSSSSAGETAYLRVTFTAGRKKTCYTLELPTHAHVHAYCVCVCVCAWCSCGLAAAEAAVCLSPGSLEAAEGDGDSVSLAPPNECLTSPGTLPSLSRSQAPSAPPPTAPPPRPPTPHLTSRQLVPSPAWPHGLATSPVEPVSLWLWQKAGLLVVVSGRREG